MTVLARCQTLVHPREHRGRGHRPAGVDDDHVTTDLTTQGVDLVPPGQPEGGAPDEKKWHVGPQPPGEGVQARRPEAHLPQAIEGHEHRGGIAATAPQASPHRDALGDSDIGPAVDAGMALQLQCRTQGQISLVKGHIGMVTAHFQAMRARPDDHVVVEVDRLEERAQLVIAVLASAQHLEAEVHLGIGTHTEGAGRPGLHRPLHRLRASSASMVRKPGWGGSAKAASDSSGPGEASSTVTFRRPPSGRVASICRGSAGPQ